MNAFISREREFLQSLAGLVQTHAETVKSMAKATRATSSQAARPSPAPAVAPVASSASVASGSAPAPSTTTPAAREDSSPPTRASADESAGDEPTPASGPAASSAEGADDEASTRVPERPSDPEPTVRLDEPAPARASRGASESDADRSLRELFWGED